MHASGRGEDLGARHSSPASSQWLTKALTEALIGEVGLRQLQLVVAVAEDKCHWHPGRRHLQGHPSPVSDNHPAIRPTSHADPHETKFIIMTKPPIKFEQHSLRNEVRPGREVQLLARVHLSLLELLGLKEPWPPQVVRNQVHVRKALLRPTFL